MTNSTTDVAVMFTPQITGKALVRCDVAVGDRVYCYSNPHGEPFVYSEGYVMKRRFAVDGHIFIMVCLQTGKGSSGVGVFSSKGEFIGIVCAIVPGTSITAVIPAELIP